MVIWLGISATGPFYWPENTRANRIALFINWQVFIRLVKRSSPGCMVGRTERDCRNSRVIGQDEGVDFHVRCNRRFAVEYFFSGICHVANKRGIRRDESRFEPGGMEFQEVFRRICFQSVLYGDFKLHAYPFAIITWNRIEGQIEVRSFFILPDIWDDRLVPPEVFLEIRLIEGG